jgi:hypothetical protein
LLVDFDDRSLNIGEIFDKDMLAKGGIAISQFSFLVEFVGFSFEILKIIVDIAGRCFVKLPLTERIFFMTYQYLSLFY